MNFEGNGMGSIEMTPEDIRNEIKKWNEYDQCGKF